MDSYCIGISADGVVITDGVVNAEAVESLGGNGSSHGIYATGSNGVSISGGTVTATGKNATHHSSGIYAEGDVVITSGTVRAQAGTAGTSNGITSTTGNVKVEGGSVTVIGDAQYGVFAKQGLTVSDGSLDAQGRTYGVNAPSGTGSITFSGGKLLAKGMLSASGKDITISNLSTYYYRTNTSMSEPDSKAKTGAATPFTVAEGTQFVGLYETEPPYTLPPGTIPESGEITVPGTYDLSTAEKPLMIKVDGVTLTGTAAANVTAIAVDTSVRSLTLSGASGQLLELGTTDDMALDMTLILQGSNNMGKVTARGKLTVKEASAGASLEIGDASPNFPNPPLTVHSDFTLLSGKVKATANFSASPAAGIFAGMNITVRGGELIARGGSSSNGLMVAHSYGMHTLNGSIFVEGGVVEAFGGTNTTATSIGAYAENGSITVSGGTLAATGGTSTGVSYGMEAPHGLLLFQGGTLLVKGQTSAIAAGRSIDNMPASYLFKIGADAAEPTGDPRTATTSSFMPASTTKYLWLNVPTPATPDPVVTVPTSLTPSTPSVPPLTIKPDSATGSGNVSGAKIELAASQLPSGVKPADVTFSAKPQALEASPVQAARAALAAIPNLPEIKGITAYDLDFLLKSSGKKVDFSGQVTVTLPIPVGYGSFLRVFHVADDGTMTEVPAVINGGNILLTLEHFSTYAIVDFASSAGKLPAVLTAKAPAATTAKPVHGGNAEQNPKTGAGAMPMAALLLMLAGSVVLAVGTKQRH